MNRILLVNGPWLKAHSWGPGMGPGPPPEGAGGWGGVAGWTGTPGLIWVIFAMVLEGYGSAREGSFKKSASRASKSASMYNFGNLLFQQYQAVPSKVACLVQSVLL